KRFFLFFFQAEDGIRDRNVTGVQTCALPILSACSKHSDSNFSPLCHGRIAIVFDNLGSISAKVWTNRAGIIGSANDVLPNVGDLTSNPIISVHNCMPGTLPENIWNIKSGP